MTYDGGYLRPLDDSEYFTAADGLLGNSLALGLNQNVSLNDLATVMKESTTINALRFGPVFDNNGSGGAVNGSTTLTSYTDHHAALLYVDGTLTISSGMVSSATFAVGNTADAATYILGGNLNFGSREAIFNAQNGYYVTTSGAIGTGTLHVRSNIMGTGGLLKTGFAQMILAGNNTYTGITSISEGDLQVTNGRTGLGAGGAGNGVVITGSGNLSSTAGVQIGSATAREDIYIGVLSGDQQILRNFSRTLNYFGNITIDNVDLAGQTIFTPRIRLDGNSNTIINGNIVGGNTAISNDITQIDSRVVQFDTSGELTQMFIFRGTFGDKADGSGNAIPIADVISTLPTVAGVRTNENEVLRVNLAAGNDQTSFIFEKQYNAAGRLSLLRGDMLINYDPNAVGNDGSGFWTNTAISRIPNADSNTTSFAINGSTTMQGFVMGNASNLFSSLFLTRADQFFNMAAWSMVGTGAKYVGGLNENGTVTFGTGTGTLVTGSIVANLQAQSGGTVVINQVITGNTGSTTAPNFGFLKQGRGTVILQNTGLASASDANFVLAGGTLVLNHTGTTVQALVANQNARFDGGTLIALASSGANTTTAFATNNAAIRVLDFTLGGNEIVARTTNTGTARNMTINMGNANANNTTSNFTRSLGATANLVEDNVAGGTAQITLDFNVTSTAAVKDAIITWLTYGTQLRTATDFAMVASASGNDVGSFGTIRVLSDYNNDVASWSANGNISENGGAGFSGTRGSALSISTLRFDASADGVIDLGSSVLTIAGTSIASSGGAILVSSNVGAANKSINGSAGAALTTTGGRAELIFHQFSTGNLNVNVPITGAINVTITGPSTVDASTIGTSGVVVFNGANTYTGKTFINGAILSISDVTQLGVNPGAATVDQITFGGGTLRYTGTGYADLGNRGVTVTGGGGTIDVVDGAAELRVRTLASTALYRGDIVKVGAGTLTLEGTLNTTNNANFQGLLDVREGALRLNGDNPSASTTADTVSTILGTNNSFADGTIFRTGTNLAIQMGNLQNARDYFIEEWLTFEGGNYVTAGSLDPSVATPAGFANPAVRALNLNGVITLAGTTTFDILSGQIVRLAYNSGYLTGSGDIIKDGIGQLEFRNNNPDWTGNLIVKQGTVYGMYQADAFGTGYLTGKTITLGSADRQGTARLVLSNQDVVQNYIIELNHDINVVYNSAQTKQLSVETVGNGDLININGNITLNDSLLVYMNDGAENGGSQNYINFNGRLLDGATTSGNITFYGDDTNGASDNTSGRTYNYAVLKADNSGWTGDVRVSANTGYDQDQTTILRLENDKALTAANDVDMGFNSILQIGGGARTIGSLTTNGGVGPYIGDTGAMGGSTNGSTEIIENAAATEGTLTITQSTPASTEVLWDAKFRNGTINSQFFAPGASPTVSAALNVVKSGDGWATMTLDNDYTGTTAVAAGILQVGRNSVGDTGAVNAAGFSSAAGTTVAGTGQIQGSATILGRLSPGDEAGASMGTLTFVSSATFGATSEITLQAQRSSYTAMNTVGYDTAGYSTWVSGITTDPTYSHLLNDPVTNAQHDQILVGGALTIVTGSKITLVNNGYNATAGDVFKLLDWNGANLTYNVGGVAYNGGLFRTGAETGTDLDLFELGSGFRWDVSLFDTQGIIVVVVPEPGRLLLLMFGLLGLCMRRRRRSTF
ncbi:beta strand repeat-containing protein [Prosthecobacter sp.]|uniref:beta strand repeat-containing protein n=1 Tax=Prosthecobacter sp. TaxID=1965333 RepID=UPI003785113F